MKLFCCLLALIVLCSAAQRRYDGYQIMEVVPETKLQIEFLRELMFTREDLDFWIEPSRLNRAVQVMVPPTSTAAFTYQMKLQSMVVKVIRENVQEDLDADAERRASIPDNLDYDYGQYNTYEDYMTELANLARQCPDNKVCSIETIGTSVEGRNMDAIIITDDPVDNSKDWFWMDSCIHAREWLACATLMKVLQKMITDPDAADQLNAFNWVVLPIFNPDGYVYTFTNDRFWRKSRNDNPGSACIGTDLNRNHAYEWGTGGSSSNPCSDTYMGVSAGSEPEVQAVEAYAERLEGNIIGWLTFHTNGEWWLHPYGDCTNEDRWVDDIVEVMDATCTAIEDTHSTNWDCGNSCQVLYGTSGTTADWAQGARLVKYSYTPELRGPGFDPPVSAIQPSFEEIWNGMVAKISKIQEVEGRKKN